MKKKPPLKFNMLIRAFAMYPKNNRITIELPNFLSPIQNHNHILVNQKSMITLISFSTSTAIGIEGYPRDAEGEDNVVVYARSLYEQGKLKEAIDHLYRLKQPDNVQVLSDLYFCLLKDCVETKDLEEGKRVHGHMSAIGFKPGIFLENHLVNMYAKCGNLDVAREVFDKMPVRNSFSWNNMIAGYAKCGQVDYARQLFDKMPKRDVVSWNAMIAGYTRYGHGEDALKLFCEMRWEGMRGDRYSLASILSACARIQATKDGRKVHAHIVKIGCDLDEFVESALVDMYGKCDRIEDARQVFDKMPAETVMSRDILLTGNVNSGEMLNSQHLLEKIPERDTVSWNAMIASYAKHGYDEEALKLFCRMYRLNMKLDHFTFGSILSVCAGMEALEQGQQVHSLIIKSAYESNVFVGSAIVDMYAKCGSVNDARYFFEIMPDRNVVSWTAVISGHAQRGQSEEALKVFYQLLQAGTKPDQFTCVSVISACANLADLKQNMQFHAYTIRAGFESYVSVGNALVTMYARCGSIEDAKHVFDKMAVQDVISWTTIITGYAKSGHIDLARHLFDSMSERNVVSWNSMIAAYVQHGSGEEALKLFGQMHQGNTNPDWITFACAVGASANLAALKQGKQIQSCIIKAGFESYVFVGNALITMYAKCGNIKDAWTLFDTMPEHDSVSWNSIITGYAEHGYGKVVLKLLKQMLQTGSNPDHITFISVLSACSHTGLVNEGRQYFNSMSQDYNLEPGIEHYACMIDLLGRAGLLNEAEDYINSMPYEPNVGIWGALLNACRIHGNLELAIRAAGHLFELEIYDSGLYVLLSNIYATAGRWEDVAKIRKMMKDRRIKKNPGCSWMEVRNIVHSFTVNDSSHPQIKEIHSTLEALSRQMKDAGYMPNTNFVLHDLENEDKENSLIHHSEKLAIAFGLINTPIGTPIQIFKNLRVCGDCHRAIKFTSKAFEREIMVRDANRFHHFKDGICSCGDYW